MNNYYPTPRASERLLEVAQAVLDWVGMVRLPNENEVELRNAALRFLARAKAEEAILGPQVIEGQAKRTGSLS